LFDENAFGCVSYRLLENFFDGPRGPHSSWRKQRMTGCKWDRLSGLAADVGRRLREAQERGTHLGVGLEPDLVARFDLPCQRALREIESMYFAMRRAQLTTSEVGGITGLSPRRVRACIKHGQIRATRRSERRGSHWMIPVDELGRLRITAAHRAVPAALPQGGQRARRPNIRTA